MRGSSQRIGPDVLLSESSIGSPIEIVYSVVQGPIGGFFQYNDLAEQQPISGISTFSQADINKQRLSFYQVGGYYGIIPSKYHKSLMRDLFYSRTEWLNWES